MTYSHQEGLNSHELHSTHYQTKPNLNPNPNQNRNAFGDDSDSDDQPNQEQRNQSPEFDVYKDFNNSGVRYATLLHENKNNSSDDESINQPSALKDENSRIKSNLIDLNKQEIQEHSIKYSNNNKRSSKFLFNKKSTLNLNSEGKEIKNRWKIGSIIAFIAVACLAVLIFFLIPRQPFISFEFPIEIHSSQQILNSTNLSQTFNSKNPTNFNFDASLSLALDGRASYLPMLIRKFKVTINDLGSTLDSVHIGTGQLDKGFTTSSTKLTPLNVNVTFQYDAKNSSDTLWQNWRKACGNINQSTTNGTILRPSLQLNVILSFNIIGIIGTRFDSTQLNNLDCPIELPPNTPAY